MRLKKGQTFYELKQPLADIATLAVKVGNIWYTVQRIAYAHGTIMDAGRPEYFTFNENCISVYPRPDKSYFVKVRGLKVVEL